MADSPSEFDNAQEAATLVAALRAYTEEGTSIGSMSVSLYDTAWVSMVRHPQSNDQQLWLFPKSFDKILASQQQNGCWPSYATEVDGILTSLACLLSLHVHAAARTSPEPSTDTEDLLCRVAKARSGIEIQLAAWNVSRTDQVGFELLVPSLLDQLEDFGSYFDFVGLQSLEHVRSRKMKRFRKEILYGPQQTTLLHSLEAFVGVADFDLIGHNKIRGSMFGSPASTAAYLINSKEWDSEAQQYLELVASQCLDKGEGGFPSAFPTSVFEISWILTLFLDVDSIGSVMAHADIERLRDFLQESLQQGGGSTGFAPGFLPDADDTAMSIVALGARDDTDTFCQAMVSRFFNKAHFATYAGERNPSLSANCNVVRALLVSSQPSQWLMELETSVEYICRAWYAGNVQDKWNTAPEYTYLTLAKSLRHLLKAWDEGKLANFRQELIAEQIPIIASDILTSLMKTQSPNGSWGSGSCEVTAFAILSLVNLHDLPWLDFLRETFERSINRGQQFLLNNRQNWTDHSYTWVEKVSYASPSLATAYCVAATALPNNPRAWTGACHLLGTEIMRGLPKLEAFLSQTQLFSSSEPVDLQLGLVQSQFFASPLRRRLGMIFPQQKDKDYRWLEFVPFTWIGCRNLVHVKCPISTLWEMMVASVLVYQADEFVESTVATVFSNRLAAVELVIGLACSAESDHDSEIMIRGLQGDMPGLFSILRSFVQFFTAHPDINRQSTAVQYQIRLEAQKFLQAHCQQTRDNCDLAGGKIDTALHDLQLEASTRPYESFHRWVRGTASDHTSAPLCFAFFLAISSPSSEPRFPGTEQQYLVQGVCRHLATKCRLINDYASVKRDTSENNLNSINFPELWYPSKHNEQPNGGATIMVEHASSPNGQKTGRQDSGTHMSDADLIAEARARLLKLADYEQQCMDFSIQQLAKLSEAQSMNMLRLFVTVTEVYNQIYLVKDLTSRVK